MMSVTPAVSSRRSEGGEWPEWRPLRFVAEYAEALRDLGPTVYRRRFASSVLVGYGLVASVGDRPRSWLRRTLPITDACDEITAVQSIVDRVWQVRKDPGGIRGPHIVLGATADCDIVVPDYSVSTEHCGFSFEPGRALVTDRGSLNGTWLNGGRLPAHASVPLTDRNALQVGRIKVQYLTRLSFFELVSQHAEGSR